MNQSLGPAQRKVLWAIMEAAQDGKTLTHREIQKIMGASSVFAAQRVVRVLRRKGLLSDSDRLTRECRTLRPLVRVEFTEEAFGRIPEAS